MEFLNCFTHSYANSTRKLSLRPYRCHARRMGTKKFKRKLSLLALVFEPWAWALRSEGECRIHWDKQRFKSANVSEPYECINAFIQFYQCQRKNVKREHSLWRLCWNISGLYNKNPLQDNMSSRHGAFGTSRKFWVYENLKPDTHFLDRRMCLPWGHSRCWRTPEMPSRSRWTTRFQGRPQPYSFLQTLHLREHSDNFQKKFCVMF